MARHKRRLHSSRINSLVGAETTLEGDVAFKGGLHVDGRIIGNLVADPGGDALVVISERGGVEGDIHAPNVVINGSVKGDITASHYLELACGARVTGSLFYAKMEMAVGARVDGRLIHRDGTVNQADEEATGIVEPLDGASRQARVPR